MPFIEWDSSFSVGSAVLDNDHRRLMDMLNGIYDAWQSGRDSVALGHLFDELLDYTNGHFAREESKLMARDYPDYDAHVAAHDRLRELVLAFRSRHLTGHEVGKLTEDMANFLKMWLLNHILEQDMKYKSYL